MTYTELERPADDGNDDVLRLSHATVSPDRGVSGGHSKVRSCCLADILLTTTLAISLFAIAGLVLVIAWMMLDFALDNIFGVTITGVWLSKLGAWLAEFLKSPAVGGVGAVFAAFIAFKSVTKQVESNRTIAAQKNWWERFEWVTAAAFPVEKSQTQVPLPLLVSTSTALKESAVDSLQLGSVSNLVSALSRLDEDDNRIRNPLSAETDREREFLRYEDATRSTPAASKAVSKLLRDRGRLYEDAVIDRLRKLPGVTPLPSANISYGTASFRNDFSFRYGNTVFHSEIHFSLSDRDLLSRAAILTRLAESDPGQPVIVTSSSAEAYKNPDIAIITLNEKTSDAELIEQLHHAATRGSGRPE